MHNGLNIFPPHVRPIFRGKDKKNTEFGSKNNVSEVNGFCRVDRLNWDTYNESAYIELQVENFRKPYGCYPKVLLGDWIYLTRKKQELTKGERNTDLRTAFGRSPKKPTVTPAQKYRNKKKTTERNNIEGKFGQGKRGYGLNNIKARLVDAYVSWMQSIFFVMNLTKLLQVDEKYLVIFVPFFNWSKYYWQKVKKIFLQPQSEYLLLNYTNLAG